MQTPAEQPCESRDGRVFYIHAFQKSKEHPTQGNEGHRIAHSCSLSTSLANAR